MFGNLNVCLVGGAASETDIYFPVMPVAPHAAERSIMVEPVQVVTRRIWRKGIPSVGSRSIPEETAVVYI
jgi:hypothetical protein